MSISQRKNYHICLLMYKLFNGLTPSACNVFEFNDDSYNFRDTTSSVLKVPHPNTELFKKVIDTVGQFCGIVYQPMYMMHVILIILNLC